MLVFERIKQYTLKLLVISHTPHYTDQDGRVVGWGPTLRELNYLTDLFEHVYHIAPRVFGATSQLLFGIQRKRHLHSDSPYGWNVRF